MIERLDRRGAQADPVAALAAAVVGATEAITPQEWRSERGRRKVILQEPDLIATGTQEIALAAARIAELVTPVDAPPDRVFRLAPFTRFAVSGFGTVPIHTDTTPAEWAAEPVRIVHLAAHGPLTEGG